jgi:uncharacterized membrane protein (UPF0127 family)
MGFGFAPDGRWREIGRNPARTMAARFATSPRRFRPWSGWVLPVLLVAACWVGCDRSAPPPLREPQPFHAKLPVRVGDVTVLAEFAVLPAEMARGLMGREALGPDEGMLFVYPRPEILSFWMRNTPLPLDIGYFDSAGVLREIYPLHPHNETPVASREPMQFALEMNQGWFRERGVRPGARLDLSAVKAGLEARGFEPERFGLR